MKITERHNYTIELDHEELNLIRSFIGLTSEDERTERFGLSREESKRMGDIYRIMRDA